MEGSKKNEVTMGRAFLNCRLQQFNCKHKNISSQSTLQLDHPTPAFDSQTKYLYFHHPKMFDKRKIIHKYNKIKTKPKCNSKPLRCNAKCNDRANFTKFIARTNLHFHINSRILTKQNDLEPIFDWMMELAYLLKITKNAYFRAILILKRTFESERSIGQNNIIQYACASLSIACKYECNSKNYLNQILIVCSKKISKSQLINAQNTILTAIKWEIPIYVLLQEELSTVLEVWGKYLEEHEAELYLKSYYENDGQLVRKVYISIVYLLDFLIIKRSQQWLREDGFKEPILIALYILFSINVGDCHLDQYRLWPHFYRFLTEQQLLEDIHRIRLQINRCFLDYKIIEVLGKIPLNLNFQKVINRQNEQFYIPKIYTI